MLNKELKQAGGELSQAQVKLEVVVEDLVEVVVVVVGVVGVKVRVHYFSGWVGGVLDENKAKLNSS